MALSPVKLADDFLVAEQALLNVLEKVDGVVKTYSTADVAEMEERAQKTPAVHVIYGGYEMASSSNNGVMNRINQDWHILLAVKLKDRKQKPGQLISNIMERLKDTVSDLGVLQQVSPKLKPSVSDGFAYYPMTFQIVFKP